MSGNHTISIDLDLLSDIQARFNWADPEFRDAVEHTLSEFVETESLVPGPAADVAKILAGRAMLGDLTAQVALAALYGNGSVAIMLGSPPMDKRWRDEYEARVSKRIVGMVAIRLYAGLPKKRIRWTGSDDSLIRIGSDGEGSRLAGSPNNWTDLLEFVKVLSPKDTLSDYIERSGIHDGSSSFDTTAARPTSTMSEEALMVDQLLNGLWPATPDEHATITQDWRCHERGQHGYFTPSVRVTLGDEATPLAKIEFAFDGNYGEFGKSSTPGDAHWEFAKHCLRVSNLLAGQLQGHLGRGHMLTGTYRKALDQVGSGHNPVWALLRPFLVLVEKINELGDPLIYGHGGIIATASGLSREGIDAVLGKVLDDETWNGWTPPHLAVPRRRGAYGEAAAAFSEILAGFVHEYVATHESEIVKHWHEVARFCAELDAERKRRKAEDPVVAVTNLGELERLAAHVIFHASFFHTWANNQQWQTGADPAKTSFGLRKPPGDADYEEWVREATPSPHDAWLQMLLADVLSHTSYGCWSDLKARRSDYQKLLSDGDYQIIEELMVALANHAAAAHLSLDNFRPFVAI